MLAIVHFVQPGLHSVNVKCTPKTHLHEHLEDRGVSSDTQQSKRAGHTKDLVGGEKIDGRETV